ncbi:MAG: tail fiber domain-containing protein, partial [Bacteroidales bacterium]
RVGIGTDCSPNAKLDVFQAHDDVGIHALINSGEEDTRAIIGVTNLGLNQIGVNGIAEIPHPDTKTQIGVSGFANTNTEISESVGVEGITEGVSDNSIGVRGIARGEHFNYGGSFHALYHCGLRSTVSGPNSLTGSSIAGDFRNGVGGGIRIGIRTVAPDYGIRSRSNFIAGEFSGQEYGIFATVDNNCQIPEDPQCDPYTGSNFAGYFAGNVHVTGNATTGSDEMFKDSVNDILGALNTIRNLQPRSFKFKTDEYDYMNLPGGTNFGLIAQEVDSLLPEIVKEIHHPAQYDSLGNEISPGLDFKGITYNDLIPITISAVQELDESLPPARPELISPENGAGDVPADVMAAWHQVEEADFYTVAYRTDYNNAFIETTTTDTSFSGNLPYFCSNYEWYVTAHNENGSSAPSDIWSFTSAAPELEPPALASPADGDTINHKEPLVWETVEDAQYYNVFISTSPDESDIVYETSLTDTIAYLDFSRLEGEQEYHWWVKAAHEQCDVFSEKSETRSFILYQDYKKKEPLLSDNNYKTGVSLLTGALDKTMQLEGKYFKWDTENNPGINDTSQQIGLIAQEVMEVIPEAVETNLKGDKGVEYNRLVAVLIEAIKEQQEQITSMEGDYQSQIDQLQDQLNSLSSVIYDCCDDPDKSSEYDGSDENNNKPEFSQNIELNNQNAIVLNQNVPNPFKEQTTISFQIPETVESARMVFVNNHGSVIRQVEIHERGTGELIVYAQDLSAGMYSYYLVADGKTIASKKMVVSGK